MLGEGVKQMRGPLLALSWVVVPVEKGALLGVDEVGAIATVGEFYGGDGDRDADLVHEHVVREEMRLSATMSSQRAS